jgi:glycosyltransferase involved in cell wall biosynthesis
MRVAIVHDYLTQRGGAERVVLAFHELFPDAPIFTSIYDPDGTFPAYRGRDIRTTFLQHLPHTGDSFRRLLVLYPLAFSRLHLKGYDLVLSSSSGWAHGVDAEDAVHVCYCYTPARWLYLQRSYFGVNGPLPTWLRYPLQPALGALMLWDKWAAGRVDHYLAISRASAERVRRFYGRPATVVHGPIEIDRIAFDPEAEPETPPYYMTLARLLPYKRIDRAIEACQRRGTRLIVVGRGPAGARLRRIAGPLVEFREGVSDQELNRLLTGCTGLIQAGDEDFGLAPLEANAAGRPVVAYGVSGALETVIDGETGVLFQEPTVESLCRAMDELESRTWDPQRLRAHATSFGKERFKQRISQAIDDALAGRLPGRDGRSSERSRPPSSAIGYTSGRRRTTSA